VPIRRELRNCLCFNVAELFDLLEKTLLALGVRTVHPVCSVGGQVVVIIHYRCSQRGQTCISICDGDLLLELT
jgi:hypothetical protein